ncbi:MAG: NADH-quinone oxidoreductase subunit NuoF [Deltaproteobacteria bacterium]|jgi:NADH-quinone oxidoreductase subunit F|nr:NADH-quinone oxidoreductase subunit NuoF [Deltaproteobacteria bacterium]
MTLIITKYFEVDDMHRLSVAKDHGAYSSLEKLFQMSPSDVVDEVGKSKHVGRGGAGFPVWNKWNFIPPNSDKPVHLIVNADESEPGTFKDRAILERDPHLLIEGMMVAAYALGVKKIFVYFRGEYRFQWKRFIEALTQAEDEGLFSSEAFKCDVIVHRGGGAYICGEETALIRSIEGERGLPKEKPPFPVTEGLFGAHTVIHNVETLCSLPFIISNGADAFASIGTEKSKGTKLISISGHVESPGVYEVVMGTPVASVLATHAGGTLGGRRLKAVVPGGTSVPVLNSEEALGARIDFESMKEAGSLLGSGGMMVLDESACTVRFLSDVARFYANESCGQCTPCREGTGWIKKILNGIESGAGSDRDVQLLVDVAEGIKGKSICPLADSLVVSVQSFVRKFREEFKQHVKLGCCPFN